MLRIIAVVVVGSVLSACASVPTSSFKKWENLNSEAIALYEKGEYDRAEVVAKQAIDLAQNEAGPDHPALVSSLNNLAAVYHAQGRYAQSESLYRRSLAIVEKALGPNDTAVATSLNNLAEVLRAQSHDEQAEPLLQRSIEIFEQSLGPDHPAVATSLNNLALLYQAQGRYAQAEPLYQRALSIVEKVLIPDYPDVLATTPANLLSSRPRRGLASLDLLAKILDNLAALYRKTNQLKAAEGLEVRAARIQAIKRQAALPPVVEITSDTVTVNGIAVTPTLAKELFFKALGEPTQFKQGVSGTPKGDFYRYNSLGLQFHTLAGEETVDDMIFWREKSSYSPLLEIFEGSLVVLGKKLPLDKVQNIRQTMPELGLERKYYQDSPYFEAIVGKWKLYVVVDKNTGVITRFGVTLQSIFCSEERKSNCLDKATNRWRAP